VNLEVIKDRAQRIISSKAYENQVRSIVPSGELWVAIKSDDLDIQQIEINGIKGYALMTGEVLSLKGHTWDDIQALARIEDFEVMKFYDEPLFKVVGKEHDIRIGLFSEVYKKGWVLTTHEAFHDFSNNPIVIRKK